MTTITPPADIDLARMRADRRARLAAAMDAAGVDRLLLFDDRNVEYATGWPAAADEPERARLFGAVALVPRRGEPHLFTPARDGAKGQVPADHLHDAAAWWTPAGAARLLERVAEMSDGHTTAGLGVDDVPVAAGDALRSVADGAAVMATARRRKTPDEIACLDRAQRIGEAAQAAVREAAVRGASATDLNRRLLGEALRRGAQDVLFEPAWHPAAARLTFPGVGARLVLSRGDIIWTDSGVAVHGLAADVGATWLIDGDAAARSRLDADRRRWSAVVDAILERVRPGASGAALVDAAIAAAGGEPPWLPHLYVVHGLGQHSAEAPLLGTAGGAAIDAATVVAGDEVLVLEPVVGGWREEVVVVVTDSGYRRIGVESGDG